jgi:adenylate kinase family enzyme
LRSAGDKELLKDLAAGVLAPTGKFKDLVLPYLQREDLKNYPLILSSVGRWKGEEYDVIAAANDGGHPIKAVLLLNVSEAEVKNRWEAARMLQDRGQRQDDHDLAILETRIKEFIDKTMPVIETYRKRDLLIPITANKDRDTVFRNALVALYDMAMREQGYDIPLEQ